jgi:hypothetical protein
MSEFGVQMGKALLNDHQLLQAHSGHSACCPQVLPSPDRLPELGGGHGGGSAVLTQLRLSTGLTLAGAVRSSNRMDGVFSYHVTLRPAALINRLHPASHSGLCTFLTGFYVAFNILSKTQRCGVRGGGGGGLF